MLHEHNDNAFNQARVHRVWGQRVACRSLLPFGTVSLTFYWLMLMHHEDRKLSTLCLKREGARKITIKTRRIASASSSLRHELLLSMSRALDWKIMYNDNNVMFHCGLHALKNNRKRLYKREKISTTKVNFSLQTLLLWQFRSSHATRKL